MTRIAAIGALAVLLGACSDDYLARRDTIVASGGDAVATNRISQMVDPWPAYSANRNLAYNGERMQAAVERYRHNRVIRPRGIDTSGSYGQQQQDSGASTPANTTPVGPTVSAPPVK